MNRVDLLTTSLLRKNIPSYILFKDRDFKYQAINNYSFKTLRLNSTTDMIGKTDFETPWAYEAEEIQKADQQVLQGNFILNSKVNRWHINGPRPMIVNKLPLLDNKQNIKGILGIIHDINAKAEECSNIVMKDPALNCSYTEAELLLTLKSILKISLSHREVQCLSLWLAGFSIKESSAYLNISTKSIEAHRTQIKNKAKAEHKFQLINLVVKKNAFDLFLDFSKYIQGIYKNLPNGAIDTSKLSADEYLYRSISPYIIPNFNELI